MMILFLTGKQNFPHTRIDHTPESRLQRYCRRFNWLLAVSILLNACMAAAAEPLASPQSAPAASANDSPGQSGANEWGLNGGGAAGIPGGVSDITFGTLNLRWGRILTSPHGPGALRGTFEYAVEITPVFVLRQSPSTGAITGAILNTLALFTPAPPHTQTVFGGGITPLLLQYNFVNSRRVVPFIQIGAGTLFTTEKVPAGTSEINFTPQGGIGVYWPRWQRSSMTWGVRYHHISNAGMTKPNPGHNGLYLYTGISWWR